MSVSIRPIVCEDIPQAVEVWNPIVEAANAFPQTDPLGPSSAERFFLEENLTSVALEDGNVLGLYILHPNNIGRCGHIANASYAVSQDARGKGVGRALVEDSLARAAANGYRGMQFNAVVESNAVAHHLYESIGFSRIGTIPGGFKNGNGEYEDMVIYFHPL